MVLDILSEKDKMLVRFCLGTPTQKGLDGLLSQWDIEEEGGQKAMLLAQIKKSYPELVFPRYFGPRLDGLLEYHRFLNLRLISRFKSFLTALDEQNVDFMPIKEMAMRCLYPDLPRRMDVLDILVRAESVEKVVSIASSLGFCCNMGRRCVYLRTAEAAGVGMIIHYSPSLGISFFSRADVGDVFGIEGMIPSREDLCFISFKSLVHGLMNRRKDSSIPMVLYSLHCLINDRPSFDWNVVYEDARHTSSEADIAYAGCFIDSVIPGFVPDGLKNLAGRWKSFTYSYSVRIKRAILYPLVRRRIVYRLYKRLAGHFGWLGDSHQF